MRQRSEVSAERGFGLIAFLVIVGLFVVAAGVFLRSFDPLELVKKSVDSKMKSISLEYLNSTKAYYSSHNALPWASIANGGDNCYTGGNVIPTVALSVLHTCLDTLVSDGKLRQDFSSLTYLNAIVMTNPNPQTGNASDSIVCFLPQSQAGQMDPGTFYNQDGSTGGSCKA